MVFNSTAIGIRVNPGPTDRAVKYWMDDLDPFTGSQMSRLLAISDAIECWSSHYPTFGV